MGWSGRAPALPARQAGKGPCLIGMEACTGAHHLSRKLQALGHDARLMPTNYVRPYSKGDKNDYRDAEAIAEAVQRPTMKFVATKTADQLDLQALHRVWCSRRNSFGHVAFRTHWNGGMVHHSKISSRCPHGVKSTHYRSATARAGSPQSADCDPSGTTLSAWPPCTQHRKACARLRRQPGTPEYSPKCTSSPAPGRGT
jgi:hypothetical protein